MSTKRKRSISPKPKDSSSNPIETIYRSAEITDRQSTFIALYSPSLQPKELQKVTEISTAGHKILAWRRESNQQSLTSSKKYVTGYDDDGERFAGKRIEQCLVNAKVTGACVVARWYGGVMLGPVRFTHIENCALEAIQKWRDAVQEDSAKKQKTADDVREKERLVEVLAARDQSITVLRKLAADKEAKLTLDKEKATQDNTNSAASSQTPSQAPTTPTTLPDYTVMTLERLKGLERARDATLSFLLKRIDKAEQAAKDTKEKPATPDV